MVHKQMLDLTINYPSDSCVKKAYWSSEAEHQEVKKIDVTGSEVDWFFLRNLNEKTGRVLEQYLKSI